MEFQCSAFLHSHLSNYVRMWSMRKNTKSVQKRKKDLKYTSTGFPYFGSSLPAQSPAEKRQTRSTNKEVTKKPNEVTSHSPKIVGTAQGRRDDDGICVGFSNLPNQVHRMSLKRGFDFTLMVVGESGLGKSTLVDSLFLTTLYTERQIPSASERIKQTVSITTSTVEIEEKGVKLKLTVVDTPGIGDAVDTTKSWIPIIEYIDKQYEC